MTPGTFRKDGIYLPRLWWWFPWGMPHPWKPNIWLGGTEFCDVPLCFTIPPFGCFLVFWRRLRTMPCDACWADMDDETRSYYQPGGHLEGGKVHQDRADALFGDAVQ